MITFHRFSKDGFVPKKQNFHYNNFKSYYDPPNLTNLNDYQKQLVLKAYNKTHLLLSKLNLSDFEYGVFAFIGGLPSEDYINPLLNHLENKEGMFWSQLSLDNNVEIYSDGDLIPEKYIAKDYLIKFGIGTNCYIPARSLK